LHGGQQEGNQNANDGDHHQQLDQGETLTPSSTHEKTSEK
jgi:hypothetical protein